MKPTAFIQKNKKPLGIAAGFVLWFLACFLFNRLMPGHNTKSYVYTLIAALGPVALTLLAICRSGASKGVKTIVLLGFLVRLVILTAECVTIDGVGSSLGLPYFGADWNMYYWSVAITQGAWNFIPGTRLYYCYQIVLNAYVFGDNVFLLTLPNLLLMVPTAGLFDLILKQFDFDEKVRNVGMFGFCFFPIYLFLNCSMLRETMLILFVTASLYFLNRYLKGGSLWNMLATLALCGLAVVYHSGMLGLLGSYVLLLLFYRRKQQKLVISKWAVIALVAVILIFLVAFFTPALGLFAYIPRSFTFLQAYIAKRYENAMIAGTANYLMDLPFDTPAQVISALPIKMFYFMFAPIWTMWRGVSDVACFLLDSCVYLVAYVCGFAVLFTKKGSHKPLAAFALIQFLFLILIHAWGVFNSGTAMRHRCKLFIFVILLICCFLQNRKERKDRANGICK